MIADLIDDKLDVRLITRNIMSVYSTNNEYTDYFIRKIKHSAYDVNNKTIKSDSFISYIKKDYNIYKNIFRFVDSHKSINTSKFIEYLDYFDKAQLLWVHFYQLDNEDIFLVETLMQLASNKPVVVTGYIDESKYRDKLYPLLFHVGLEDRLIIVPCKDIKIAVNNSTCQCYVKCPDAVKIQSRFPDKFINEEFKTSDKYYTGHKPPVYVKDLHNIVKPISYSYTFYEIILIFLFSIKSLYIAFFNWRQHVNRLPP